MSSLFRKKYTSCCTAVGCSMRAGTNLLSEVKMYSFPRDPDRRKRWEIALRRKNWHAKSSSRLCNRHFISGKPSQDPSHPDYVPSVFCYSEITSSKNQVVKDCYDRLIKRRKTENILKQANIDEKKSYTQPFKCNVHYEQCHCMKLLSKKSQKNKKKTDIANDNVKKELHKKTMKEMVEGIHAVKMRKQKKSILKTNNDVNKAIHVKAEKKIDEEIHPITDEQLYIELSVLNTDFFPDANSSNFQENFIEEVGNSDFETQLLQDVSSDICTFDEETNFSGNESAEVLKRKLKESLANNKILKKRYEEFQVLCKLYMKENASLRKVIDNLTQIISVSNDS